MRESLLVIKALEGKISNPILISPHSYTRLVESGPGMVNLPDENDRIKWSGINNHVVLISRYSSFLASELEKKGVDIDPKEVLNGMILSHAGRRQWDEAQWYYLALCDLVGLAEADFRKNQSSEELTVKLLENNPNIVNSVKFVKELWNINTDRFDALLGLYVDCRTSQELLPLYQRMGFMVFDHLVEKENKTPEMKKTIYKFMKTIIKNKHITLEEADQRADKLGLLDHSSRLNRKLLLRITLKSAKFERKIKDAGINLKKLNYAPEPQWEINYRKNNI